VRLIDRVLSRDAGYNEGLYSGAYVVTAADPSGRDREGPAPVIRHAREAYASNGIVFACIAARMALFAEAEFTFRSQIDKHLFGTADLELLEQPWPNATAGELLARMEADVSWAGNSYIRRAQAAGDAGPQLVQMRPDCTIIVTEEARDELGRTFRRPVGYSEDLKPLGIDREPQFFTVDEVAHYSPVPDPSASFRGMSWLTPVMREIGADQALTQYKTSHVSRGAMPGMVLKYSQKLSEPTVEKLKKRFAALFAGPENAGKTLVLDEGADVTVAGSTLEQLQFTRCRRRARPGSPRRRGCRWRSSASRGRGRRRGTTSWRSAGSRTCGPGRTGGWRARACSTCCRRCRPRRACGTTCPASRRCARGSWPGGRRCWSARRR
jgi:hypothetical protein